jgi:cytochrome c oxidase subunit II
MYGSTTTQASNFVKGVDSAFLLILGISFLLLICLTVVMLYFIYKYNNKRHPKATQLKGSVSLEITWTVIPFIITMVMFYYGWAGWKPMLKPPKDSMQITVYAQMWKWSFEYNNGRRTDTLYVPQNVPVKLNLKSLDVIHSLYIPAFRVKQDVVPGLKDNFMWFRPEREGTFELFCSQYCGLHHSYMYTSVVVMPKDTFNHWLANATQVAASIKTAASPAASGQQIMKNIGCFACHTINGSRLVGPSFKGVWGSTVTVNTAGKKHDIVVDEDYVRRSILDPNADVVNGFNKGLMLTYKGKLTDDDINQIIAYLKTLK